MQQSDSPSFIPKKKKKSNTVTVTNEKTGEKITYYLDPRLKRNLDEKVIPSLKNKDKDCVLCFDGAEGSGKSTMALQVGRYVDHTLDLSRVVFDAESFRQAIFKAKKRQCVIFDEAFTGLSSRSSLSAMNRVLVSLMMQVRQKNLFIIFVLPTFFLLDKYVAIFRSRALIHVYESKGIRGYYKLYNKKVKKYLYLAGAKTYSYNHKNVWTRNKGRFYGTFALGGPEVEKKYRDIKIKALENTETNPMSSAQVKYRDQRNLSIYLLRKITGAPYEQLSNLLNDYDIDISGEQIRLICSKYGDKGTVSKLDQERFKEMLMDKRKIIQDASKTDENVVKQGPETK